MFSLSLLTLALLLFLLAQNQCSGSSLPCDALRDTIPNRRRRRAHDPSAVLPHSPTSAARNALPNCRRRRAHDPSAVPPHSPTALREPRSRTAAAAARMTHPPYSLTPQPALRETRSRTAAAAARTTHLPYSLIPQPALRLPSTLSAQESLRQIAQEPDLHRQIGFHVVNSGLYAHDRTSSGVLYCVARVPTKIIKQRRLSQAEFFSAADLKFGVTKDLPARRRSYAACEGNGYVHLWLFSMRTRQRCRLERLLHLSCSCFVDRDSTPCSGKRCPRVHREFWPLRHLGSFDEICDRLASFQVAIGEPNGKMVTLDGYDLLFPRFRAS
ncbi:hypothetical protein B0H16DRAFT_1740779 [Mycena metata]|uniref:Uncharacterized protein n=1 Tax=Mycena metata TaxID=1033252 RepID=A0AAD7HCI4_9AGAR|nr:hypothetical protein B0H16DRAFT_1740779 [Mycena metata]